MSQHRRFIPETDVFHPEKISLDLFTDCNKKENHDQFLSPSEIGIEKLPEQWKNEEILPLLKDISRRVVHLTVLKSSSSRPGINKDETSHINSEISCGSGFLTFDPVYGTVIHTSKHVVYDDFEASMTVVRLFYNEEDDIIVYKAFSDFITAIRLNESTSAKTSSIIDSSFLSEENRELKENPLGLFLSRGNCKYFKSVMCCDYTAFTCDIPIHELFSKKEVARLEGAFSWWNFSFKSFLFSPQADISIAIISHPHGLSKRIAFGKMNRLVNVTPSLYDATTCKGSSGSPVIRLHSDGKRLLSVGQFVHHGHNKTILDLGMGMIRPPFAFPYMRSLDTEKALANAVGILYEPICYWAMFVADLLHVESTITNSLDVFAYTSTTSALFLTIHSRIFQVLFTGFWIHLLCGFLLNVKRSGLSFAVANLIGHLISMLMFVVAWILIFWAPPPLNNMFIIAAIWIIVLFVERYYYLNARFVNFTFGSFPELAHFRLQTELGIKLKKKQHLCDLDTTHNN